MKYFKFPTCTGNRVHSRSVILNDSSSASLNSQNTSHFQNNVLRGRPSTQFTGQFNTDDLIKIPSIKPGLTNRTPLI